MIERVILSAGAMLIFSVSFQIDHVSEDGGIAFFKIYIGVVAGPGRRWAVKRSASALRLAHTTHGPGDVHGFTGPCSHAVFSRIAGWILHQEETF